MKGILNIYMNYNPEKENIHDKIRVFMESNVELAAQLKQIGYQFMVIPCTNEAHRVEKIDFDQPFPRFSTKTHSEIKKRAEELELQKGDK